MSGGRFDHQLWRLKDIADVIDETTSKQGDLTKNEWGDNEYPQYSSEVLEHFVAARKDLSNLYGRLRAIDYLLSGDTGEDTFLSRMDHVEPGW